MRLALLGLLFVAAAGPAVAADAPAPRRGVMLRDVNNVRLAAIDAVKADGSVGIIIGSRYVIVPADTLSMADGKLVTKLTKAQVTQSK